MIAASAMQPDPAIPTKKPTAAVAVAASDIDVTLGPSAAVQTAPIKSAALSTLVGPKRSTSWPWTAMPNSAPSPWNALISSPFDAADATPPALRNKAGVKNTTADSTPKAAKNGTHKATVERARPSVNRYLMGTPGSVSRST